MKSLLCKIVLVACLVSLVSTGYGQSFKTRIQSPGKKIAVDCWLSEGAELYYKVAYNGKPVLLPSRLGIEQQNADFTKALTWVKASSDGTVSDQYLLLNGKRKNNRYKAVKKTIHLKNAQGVACDVIWQVSDDGIAFRYYFPGKTTDTQYVKRELTSFKLDAGAKGFLQPMSAPQTGWQHVNPCYEEYYEKGVPAGTPASLQYGWVFPALFQTGSTWLLFSEASVDVDYCASRLVNDSASTEYKIGFPGEQEVFTGRGFLPRFTGPYYTPWRLVVIGSLATIAESTLGTDLAQPAVAGNFDFAKTGKASWSWPILKDDSIVYPVQKRFIDYAADMNWQYCLIDVDWDTRIGYDSIQALVNYAKQKNVGVWLWYNSAGSWNTAPYHPRDMLLTHEKREAVFSRLEKMGVAGTKIDFFGGDGQSMMQYYFDIMKDAAAHHIMVNFHGATLPRGWQRTFPNLMTAEAIKGFEYITFEQKNANEEPQHAAMLPFTRNAFDPMDFTPMSLYKIPRIERRTTAAFELALSVLFLSGVQHFAETPDGMNHMPGYIKDFLRNLPTHWDDVKFIDGFPGRYVVLARQYGNKWYIAGINASAETKEWQLDVSKFKGQKLQFIYSNKDVYFGLQTIDKTNLKKQTVQLAPNDGFVMVIE